MKKKVFLAIIAVLVICLTCGMLLVACNNKDDNGGGGGKDPGKNPGGGVVPPVTAIDIMQDIIDDFDEVAKDTSGDKEFNFGLEILDGEKPVFAIATETIGGNDYLYGAVGNNMKKFNGLDLGGVVETVLSWLGTDIMGVVNLDADKFLDGMVGLILPGILGTYEVAENGEAYRMEVALSGVISLIDGSEESLVDINELIGDAAGTVNGIIDTVCGLLGITNEEIGIATDATVTLGNFLTYISKFTVNAYFGFGANADKAQEATNATANPFGNLAFGERVKAAREATAINILNFEGQVKIETLDETNNVKHTYLLDIAMDANPFVLLKDNAGGCGLLSLLELADKTKDLLDKGNKLVFKDFEIADILDMLSEQHLLPLRGGLNLTVNGRSIWLNIPWLQMLQLQNALFFALIAIMLMVFIGNVIKVGTNRYYLGAASGPQPFSTLFSAFSSHYLNVVKVMFLVSVKILAWSLLLVIPGIIKSYEYRMIPYLLAQQPDMRAEDAFALSRKMTMGHKAEMFVLSLSFLGWLILGTLAFRIGVWFVRPYIESTWAQLYLKLQENTQTV